jgi:hypothetical protein
MTATSQPFVALDRGAPARSGPPGFLQVRARPIPILPLAHEWPPLRARGSNMWGSLPSTLGGGVESPHQVEFYLPKRWKFQNHGRLVPIGRDPLCGIRGDLLVPIGRHPNVCGRKDATARTRRDFRCDRAASAPEWSGGKLRGRELLPASAGNLSGDVVAQGASSPRRAVGFQLLIVRGRFAAPPGLQARENEVQLPMLAPPSHLQDAKQHFIHRRLEGASPTRP